MGVLDSFGLPSTGLSTGESNYFVCDLATQEIRCVHLDACLGLSYNNNGYNDIQDIQNSRPGRKGRLRAVKSAKGDTHEKRFN